MIRRVRLGMLTPSSNTVLEPVTMAMLAYLPDVSAHFSRFKVTEIALSEQALGQFDDSEILRAAELLAHAKVDAIAWNGTSASWLGFDRVTSSCASASAPPLALPPARPCWHFARFSSERGSGGWASSRRIAATCSPRSWRTGGRRGFTAGPNGICGCRIISRSRRSLEEEIANLVRAVARDGCDAVAIVCTNMRGAGLAEPLERELGIPIYDSIATTLWKSLAVAGISPRASRDGAACFRMSGQQRSGQFRATARRDEPDADADRHF